MWHWFDTELNYDIGYVEIRETGQTVWTRLASYTGSGNGVWTQPLLDLGGYAGKKVELGFRFASNGAAIEKDGWYIDDVTIVTGPSTLNNPEGFELGLGDWAVESGIWEVGVPTSGPPANAQGRRAFAGTQCAGTVLAGNYVEDSASRLISPAFVVPAANLSPRLRFWQWFQLGASDVGRVQIRVGTNAWQALGPDYAGNSGGVWVRPSLDLTAFANKTVQLGFWFESHTDYWLGATVGPGWFVDEVAIAIAGRLIDATRWQVEILGPSMLTSEVAQLVEERRPALVCIGSVAPGGMSHTRHLCKRLRARCPDVSVVVGRFGLHDESADEQQQLAEAGADHIATTMRELGRHVAELSLRAETSGSEDGKTQEMGVPAACHPLLDARPV
jgi:hypothetical protein